MDEKSCVIYSGPQFTLEWYYDRDGRSIAYDYFEESTEELQDKFFILAKRMGDFGKIFDNSPYAKPYFSAPSSPESVSK